MVGRIAVAILVAGLHAGAEAPRVDLRVEAGLGGLARRGQAATIRVRARSGADVDGALRVITGTEWRHAVPYEVPLALARNGRKVVEIPVLLPAGCACRVEYVATSGDVLASVSPVVVDLEESALVVVVGPNALGVPLAAMSTERKTQAVLVAARELPSHWAGLVPATAVVLDDRSWAGLEEEQRLAMQRWVERGGHLVLGLSDPTLPEVRGALVRWLGRDPGARVAGDPPRVELYASDGEALHGAGPGEIGRRVRVGGGSVTLIGVSTTDPAWGSAEDRRGFWALLAEGLKTKGSAACAPHLELAQVASPSILWGMSFYVLIAMLASGFIVWRTLQIRKAARRGAIGDPARSRRVVLGVAGFVIPFGVFAGLSWRVGETRCDERTTLRRVSGSSEWSVESSLRLESRWGWSGAARLAAEAGVAGLAGPRVEAVRAPWRRGAALDDAFAGGGRAGSPRLRLLGGDRVILWGRGVLPSTELDAIRVAPEGPDVVLENRTRLTLRRVRIAGPRALGEVAEVPPGGSARFTSGAPAPPEGPWFVAGEVLGLDSVWEIGEGMSAGTRAVRFEAVWP